MKFNHQFENLEARVKNILTPQSNQFFISLFIIVYFTVVAIWLWLNLPVSLKPREEVCKNLNISLGPIVILMGLQQNWNLFSPSVKTYNAYNLVATTFQSGFVKLSELSRMDKLNLLQKTQQEKLRKFFNDNLANQKFSIVNPAVARFLARSYNKPTDPPTRISFFLVSSPILPPSSRLNKISEDSSFTKSTIENYFDYGVSPEDL